MYQVQLGRVVHRAVNLTMMEEHWSTERWKSCHTPRNWWVRNRDNSLEQADLIRMGFEMLANEK